MYARGIVRLAIGIPTRNRAELAVAAIESVLRAARPGVAVVVSDNSDDERERRRLAELCADLPGGAVTRVQPPQPLAMADHWEWLRRVVTERADPTHVTYLTDRMVFLDGALDVLLEVAERHPGTVVSYLHDRVEDLRTPVELVQSQWTGRLYELDARTLLGQSSRGLYGDHLPRMLNSIVPVETFTEIERRFGDVFAPPAPDYGFAYRCLAVRDRVLFLDRACLIQRGMGRSSGIAYLRGEPNEAAIDFRRRLTAPPYEATPEPRLETIANAVFQEYCAARRAAGGDRFPPVRTGSYLRTNAISVAQIVDRDWRARMEQILRERGWTRRRNARYVVAEGLAMIGFFVRHPSALARSVRRQLWHRPPGTPAANLLPRIGIDPRVRDDLRFASPSEAIAHANAHPRPRTPYSWNVHRIRDAIVGRL